MYVFLIVAEGGNYDRILESPVLTMRDGAFDYCGGGYWASLPCWSFHQDKDTYFSAAMNTHEHTKSIQY